MSFAATTGNIIVKTATREAKNAFGGIRRSLAFSVQRQVDKNLQIGDEVFLHEMGIDRCVERDNSHGALTVGFRQYPKAAAKLNRILQRLKAAGFDLSRVIVLLDEEVFRKNIGKTGKFANGLCHHQVSVMKGPSSSAAVSRSILVLDPQTRAKFFDRLKYWSLQCLDYAATRINSLLTACFGIHRWKTAARHPLGTVFHELTHALHFQNLVNVFGKTYAEKLAQLKLPDVFWKNVKRCVSAYAASEKKPIEVIAEIGAAKLAGQELKLTPDVQRFWNAWWKGKELPFGLCKDIR